MLIKKQDFIRTYAYLKVTSRNYSKSVQRNADAVLDIFEHFIKINVGKHVRSASYLPIIGWMKYYNAVEPPMEHKGYYSHILEVLSNAQDGYPPKINEEKLIKTFTKTCETYGVEYE